MIHVHSMQHAIIQTILYIMYILYMYMIRHTLQLITDFKSVF